MRSRQTVNELVYLRADDDHEIGSKAIFAQNNVVLTLTDALTLKIVFQIIPLACRLMMMYHHTRFGYKRFSDSEDIIRINIS